MLCQRMVRENEGGHAWRTGREQVHGVGGGGCLLAKDQGRAVDPGDLPVIEVVSEGEPAMKPGQTSAFFKVEFEEAKEAAQWAGVHQDLWFVVRAVEQILAIHQRQTSGHNTRTTAGDDDVLMLGLWSAALIAYRRCFNIGVRGGFTEEVFGDREDVLNQHRYFLHIRGKHIAHSVNPFEMSTTGIGVRDLQTETPDVFSAVTMHRTKAMERTSTISYLGELSTWLRTIAGQRRDKVLREVLRKAQSLTNEEIRRLDPLQDTPKQGYEVAGESRPPNQPKEAKKKRRKEKDRDA